MGVSGLVSTLKAIVWAFFLIFGLLILWAIMSVELLGPLNRDVTDSGYYEKVGCERCPRAFSTVWNTVLTYYQMYVCGDSWGELALPMIEQYPVSLVVFSGITFTVVLGLMNLVLAVIVDVAVKAQNNDAELKRKGKL